jgi:dihydroorotase
VIEIAAFVDMHCHLREPGFPEKETFETGLDAAYAGGFGAVCPMANTNPVNDNVETLRFMLRDGVYPICAVTKGLQGKELVDFQTLKDNGAIAFSDDGRPVGDMKLLLDAMQIAKELGILLISHAEDLATGSEEIAVERELEILPDGVRYHFAHISREKSLNLIRLAKKSLPQLTCETAPHYFSLTNATQFRVNPPLVVEQDKEAVIEAFKDGTIDVIATDHAPHTLAEKLSNTPPPGIAGFETAFGVGYTYLVKAGHLTLGQLSEKMSHNPAKILRITNDKTILVDTDCEWTVRAADFKSKCKISPFERYKLTGKVII